MRKNLNSFHVEGYVYSVAKLKKKISGESSKNPGTEYIKGDLEIAIDEEGLNVIPINFAYVTALYSKSQKPNNTFTVLSKLIDDPNSSWLVGGKENAVKVKIDGSLGLNDFISADNQQRISARRCEGSFVSITSSLCEESKRNTFQTDIVINRVNHVDADPDKQIENDFINVSGVVFNWRNAILPVEFVVHNAGGMKYFESLEVSPANPIYTKIWGRINNQTIKVEVKEESAFGGEDSSAVTFSERKNREWVITGVAKVPYDFGDEEVLTQEDLDKAGQDREVYWADIQKRNEEYQASEGIASVPSPASPAVAAKTAGFQF